MQNPDLNKAYYLQGHFFSLQFSVQSSSHKRGKKNICIKGKSFVYSSIRALATITTKEKKTQKTNKQIQENHISNPHNNFTNKLQKHQTVDQSSISAKNKEYPIHILKHKTKMYKNPKKE